MRSDRTHTLVSRITTFLLVSACAVAAVPAHAACPPNSVFQFSGEYTAGNFATSVAAGDFNNDGFTDLAVTNYSDNTVSIFLGRGDGSFNNQYTLPTESGPRGIATADVDGDGILDLVVTNVGAPTLSVLRGLGSGGHGNGSFAARVTYSAGFENRGIAIADLNGDGHPDLVVAGRTSAVVLLNQFVAGSWGKFPSATTYATTGSWGVTLGDFNGDGHLDIAAGNWIGATVSLFFGNGTGGFSVGPIVTVPGGCADITSGDLNGDGIRDIVAAGSSGVWVLKGNGSGGLGDGTFVVSAFAQLGHQFNDVIIGDMNGDGRPDIVGTDTDGLQAVFLPGDGSGAFNVYATFAVGTGPIGLVSFDANGDLVPDVFVVCSASGGYPGVVDALLGACQLPDAPQITQVRDVPHDQGGKVFVLWSRSRGDNPINHSVTSYRVWRRDPLQAAASSQVASNLASFDPNRHTHVALRVGGLSAAITYWEPMTVVPAAYLDGYAYTAPTTQDSLPDSNPYTAFFIQALTADPYTFWNSAPDSGYSVDNLAPAPPAPFVGAYLAGATQLHWGKNAEPDLAGYKVYRGDAPDFAPGPGSLIAAKADTGYADVGPAGSYYKLSSVDIHGNESAYNLLSPGATLGVSEKVASFALAFAAPSPNPARDQALVSFTLPQNENVSLAVYDMAGRRLRTLNSGAMDAGPHQLPFDLKDQAGRAMPSGLYFLRLEAGGRTLVRRLAIVE
jgi:FG-GAP-like repeat/FlgD Ig-like domain